MSRDSNSSEDSRTATGAALSSSSLMTPMMVTGTANKVPVAATNCSEFSRAKRLSCSSAVSSAMVSSSRSSSCLDGLRDLDVFDERGLGHLGVARDPVLLRQRLQFGDLHGLQVGVR